MIICSLFFVSAPWNTDMMTGVQATTADTLEDSVERNLPHNGGEAT